MKPTEPQHGFIFLDLLVGMMLLTIVGVVLAVTLGGQTRTAERLAASRDAARSAEQALLDLQQGHPVASTADRVIDSLGPVQGSNSLHWTRVRAVVNGRSATVIGVTGGKP